MCFCHQASRVIAHFFADTNEFCQDFIIFLSEAPYLVVSSGSLTHFASLVDDLFSRSPVSVNTHNRAEGTKLEPTHKQLLEVRIFGHTAVESADIGCPPRNAAKSHMKACADLFAEVLVG